MHRGCDYSGFFNKLVAALGTMNVNLSAMPGNTNRLMAAGAGEIATLPILQPVEELHKLLILLPAAAHIPGKHPINHQYQRDIRKDGQKCRGTEPTKDGQYDAENQQDIIQLVSAVAAIHKAEKALLPTLKHINHPMHQRATPMHTFIFCGLMYYSADWQFFNRLG